MDCSLVLAGNTSTAAFVYGVSILGKAPCLFWKNLRRIGLSDLPDLMGFPEPAQDSAKAVWPIPPGSTQGTALATPILTP